MKSLLILRHAKSDWGDSSLPDHDRPLAKRGQKDAPRVGKVIHERGLDPQVIVCSGARRARQTAEAAIQAGGLTARLQIEPELYGGGAQAYLDALNRLPPEVERAMVVGHNPDLEDLLSSLTGRVETLPTAALALVKLPVQAWDQVKLAPVGELVFVWRPKD
jgi:phosphohistidine phosphatase